MTAIPLENPRPLVTITVDGRAVTTPADNTILDTCRNEGIDIPTLCYLDGLTPANSCRVCMVEVLGSRTLVPACSRQVTDGMAVETENERVATNRKLVFELLASSVDMSVVDEDTARWMDHYNVDPDRFGEGVATVGPTGQDSGRPLHTGLLEVHSVQSVCVRMRRRRPEHVCHLYCRTRLRKRDLDGIRRFPSRFGVRLLRQLRRRLPHRSIDGQDRVRHAPRRHLGRRQPERHTDGVYVLRRRLQFGAPRSGQRDSQGDLTDGPFGHQRSLVYQGPLWLPARSQHLRRHHRCSPVDKLDGA